MRTPIAILGLLIGCAALASPAVAQHATVSTPFNTNSSSFFEQIGVGFNFNIGGFHFQQNGNPLAAPQFGQAVPNAGATTGFALSIPGGMATFNINASQGSRQSMVSQTGVTTMSNGVPGFMSDTTQTPFVVSQGPQATPALERWQQMQEGGPAVPRSPRNTGSASDPPTASGKPKPAAAAGPTASGTLSVAELRQLRAGQAQASQQSLEAEALALAERAREAEQNGKPSVARLYYQQAAQRATGPVRDELLSHAEALSTAAAAGKKPPRTPSAQQ